MRLVVFLLGLFPLGIFAQADSISSIIERQITHTGKQKVHNILFYLDLEETDFVFHEGFGLVEKNGEKTNKDAQFKIASITKPFVSTIILQLVEEGKLQLNDYAYDYLKEIDFLDFENIHIYEQEAYGKSITIEQLLSHRSGLADIFNDKGNRFFLSVFLNKKKQYSPQAIIDKYNQYQLNEQSYFKPGESFYYSDMNYVLLGLLIQEVEKMSLSEAIRTRILEPLKMQNTFFEFYESSINTQQQVHQYINKRNMTKVNTSFDWAGGGLVSTTSDLAIFMKALFNGELMNEESLQKMTAMKFTQEHHNRYGLGLYESEYNGDIYYGHYGFYGSYLGYCPETKTVIAYSISQSDPTFYIAGMVEDILKLVSQ